MNELRQKHKEFAKEYVKNGQNATQAVLEVYPDTDYDYANKAKAPRLMANDGVQQEIKNNLPTLDTCAKKVENIHNPCIRLC